MTVADSATPEDSFAQLRETDLLHAFTNPTQQKAAALPPPLPLPPVAASIPNKPPANWPKFDPTKPATDFQLQMALKLIADMKPASTTTAAN